MGRVRSRGSGVLPLVNGQGLGVLHDFESKYKTGHLTYYYVSSINTTKKTERSTNHQFEFVLYFNSLLSEFL